MNNSLPQDFDRQVSDCIAELKSKSSVLDLGDIVTRLRKNFPQQKIDGEEILPRILSAARAYGVALKLDKMSSMPGAADQGHGTAS